MSKNSKKIPYEPKSLEYQLFSPFLLWEHELIQFYVDTKGKRSMINFISGSQFLMRV